MATQVAPRRAPICIAGMHRSGTSMIARLLNLCGVYLGPRDGMLPPQADNPAGFWELRRFVDINEALLSACGGTWDRPPAGLTGGLTTDPEFAPLRLEARELAAEFRGHEPWGFKDPRNSLTLDAMAERCRRLDEQVEQARKNASAWQEQSSCWRALAERGEPVRVAWRKMTVLLADRDPAKVLERLGPALLDGELREVVRLYAISARDEGQGEVADDLDRLCVLIDTVSAAGRPASGPRTFDP